MNRDNDAERRYEHFSLVEESRRYWEDKGRWWAERLGEGNQFQREIINPAVDKLLAVQPDEEILEIACGNGNFARRLATSGCHVVATDFSDAFLAYARENSSQYADLISFQRLDATDAEQIRALSAQRFDAAVCNMAVMDMAAIDPLFHGLATVLKPGGRFVFSVSHPCFNSIGSVRIVEQETVDGRVVERHAIKVHGYMNLEPALGEISVNDPTPHLYFDRPISNLMNAGFRAGFVVDGFEEPLDPAPADPDRPLVWQNLDGIPPALVIRMRLP